MASLIEDTKGKIRDLPIDARLRSILIKAADAAGVDVVRVISGGQAKKGTPGKRTGSTRHDLGMAADLMLVKDDRTLDFTKKDDLKHFEDFVKSATIQHADGIGAGVSYMGPLTIHVGFGAPATWGKGGLSANAPAWLVAAVNAGRKARSGALTGAPAKPAQTSKLRLYKVVARSGLRLRSGPGTDFHSPRALMAGTQFQAEFSEAHPDWAKIDLEGDGHYDGFVFASFITPV